MRLQMGECRTDFGALTHAPLGILPSRTSGQYGVMAALDFLIVVAPSSTCASRPLPRLCTSPKTAQFEDRTLI